MLTREGCRDWRWDSAGWVYLYTYTFTSTWVVGLLTSEELRFVYVERGGKSKFTDPRDEITSLRASQTVYSLKWHPRWSTRRKDDECVPLEKLSKGNEKEVEESSATTNVDSDSSWEEREKRMPSEEDEVELNAYVGWNCLEQSSKTRYEEERHVDDEISSSCLFFLRRYRFNNFPKSFVFVFWLDIGPYLRHIAWYGLNSTNIGRMTSLCGQTNG